MTDFLNTYKEIFPLATFVFGYIVNAIINTLGSKRHTEKVKKVLLHEVNHNLAMLELTTKKKPYLILMVKHFSIEQRPYPEYLNR